VAPVRARLMSLLLRPTTPTLWLGIVVATSFIVIECLLLVTLKHLLKRSASEYSPAQALKRLSRRPKLWTPEASPR